MIFFLPVVYGY
jgi:hypothetical protein